MKKFIMAILSLVLAGSMVFGIAACSNNSGPNNGGGGPGLTAEQKWAKMFEDVETLDNATFTVAQNSSMDLKYNGEYVTEDTVFEDEEVRLTMQMLLTYMMGGENPSVYERTQGAKVDYANGKAEMFDNDYSRGDTYIVDGTTVKEHYWTEYFDSDGNHNGEGYYTTTIYKGYSSNEMAKEALKSGLGIFEYSMLYDLFAPAGTEEEDLEEAAGTLAELYNEFSFDSATDKYTADLYYLNMGIDMTIEITVKDGYLSTVSASKDMDMSFADYMKMSGEFEWTDEEYEEAKIKYAGITMLVSMSSVNTISDIGTTVVTVPTDIEELESSSKEVYVLNETTYKSMFNGLLGNEGTVSLMISNYNDGVSTRIDVNYNAELNIAKITNSTDDYENDIHQRQTKLYWATDDGMKIYTAQYEVSEYGYLEFKGWSNKVESQSITGDKTAALLALLPAEMQYYFNFNGKPMAEQFSLFELVGYNDYEAIITVDGKEVKIKLEYGYDETAGRVYFNGYNIRRDGEYTYVSLGTGNLINSNEGLPEVEGTTVTESQWKAIVEPWYNLKNVTIENGGDRIVIDIAADGKSGKIYNVSEYEGSRRYIEFEWSHDEFYTMTRYYCEYNGWDDENHKEIFTWYKEQHEVSYEELLSVSGAYILSYISEDLGNSWANVTYNPMTKGYVFNDGGDENYTILVGEGKFTFDGWTLSNKGTTVAGEIPADILASAEEM